MSVIIWKDGKSEMCEARKLQQLLKSGYTLTEKPEKPKKKDSDKRQCQ